MAERIYIYIYAQAISREGEESSHVTHAMPSLAWTRVPISGVAPSVLDRSSHSLAVVGNKAYLFGGENVPRTPVDDELYIIDLNGTLDGPLTDT